MNHFRRVKNINRERGSMPIALFITIMFLALSVALIGVVATQIAQNKAEESARLAHIGLGSAIAISAEQIGPSARALTNLPTTEPSTWTSIGNDNNNSFYHWWVSASSNAVLNSSNIPNGNWASITYVNNTWVAINDAGTAFTSPNGIVWTQRNALPNAGSLTYTNVIYGLGSFIATASTSASNIATSVDGITWTSVAIAAGTYIPACSTTTCAFLSTTTASGYYSSNLTSFTAMSSVPFIAKDVTFAVSNFVMSGNNAIATSGDASTWTSRTVSAHNWGLVGNINGIFVAANVTSAGSTAIVTSSDGINWTDRVLPQAGNWIAIATAGPQIGLFSGPVGGVNQSSYLASSDTQTWISSPLPAGAPWTGAAGNYNSFFVFQVSNPSYSIPVSSGVNAAQSLIVTARLQQGRVSNANNGQYYASMTYTWNVATKKWLPSKYVGPSTPGLSLVPNAPTGVTGVRTAPGTIVVSWIAPSSSGSGPIISYLATAGPGGYYCPSGGALSSTTCTLTTTVAATYNGSFYSCTNPDVLIGVTCQHTTTYAAIFTPTQYKCTTGDSPGTTSSSTFTCTHTYSSPVTVAPIYNCPSLYSPSGNQSSAVTCTKTYLSSGTAAVYNCTSGDSPAGSQPVGTLCTHTYTSPGSGAIYQCTSGDSPAGNQGSAVTCTHTYTSPGTAATYQCASGDSPSGVQASAVTCTHTHPYDVYPTCPAGPGPRAVSGTSSCTYSAGPWSHSNWSCSSGSTLTPGSWEWPLVDSFNNITNVQGQHPLGRCGTAGGSFSQSSNTCLTPGSSPISLVYWDGIYDLPWQFGHAITHDTICSSGGVINATNNLGYCGFYITNAAYSSLSGSNCSQTLFLTANACSSGINTGSSCQNTYPAPVLSAAAYNCTAGDSPSGTQSSAVTCSHTYTASLVSSATYTCTAGDSPSGTFGSAVTCSHFYTIFTLVTPGSYTCTAGDSPSGTQTTSFTCTATTTASLTTLGTYACTAGDSPAGNQSSVFTCSHTYTSPVGTAAYYSCTTGDTPGGTQVSTFTCTNTTYPAATFNAAYYSCGSGSLYGNVCVSSSTYAGSYNSGGYTCASASATNCTMSGMANGVFTFTVVAINSAGASVASVASPMVSPQALALSYPSTVFSTTQTNIVMTPVLTGSSGASITYSESGSLPSGVSFNTSTGAVTGPSSWASQVGYPFTITVTATDSLTGFTAITPVTFSVITP